jgi:phosphoribosylformylglycinamidine synthase subunit PurSL
LAYKTPFISGKDSLNNEYRAADGSRTPIPPTLLISALAIVPDIRQAVTMDLKQAGNPMYLVGITRDELLGSHYALIAGDAIAGQTKLPQVDLVLAPRLMGAVHSSIQKNSVRACHDLSEGGLAVAAAEMAFAGGLGLTLDLRQMANSDGARDDVLLFSESASRFLIEVEASQAEAFEAQFAGLPCARIGQVEAQPTLTVLGADGVVLIEAATAVLQAAWKQVAV